MADKKLEEVFDNYDVILVNFKSCFEKLEEYMLNDEMDYDILLSFCSDMLKELEDAAYNNVELAESLKTSNKTALIEGANQRYEKIRELHNMFMMKTAKLISREELSIHR